jgi:hypothetical protein
MRISCNTPELTDDDICKLTAQQIDKAIADRMTWLRSNNEKERMGRKRY